MVMELEITHKPDRTVFDVGEPIDITGMEVEVHYSDGTTKDVDSSQLSVVGYQPNVEGSQLVVVSYEGATEPFTVTVKRSVVESVTAKLKSTTWYAGDVITADNVTLTVKTDIGERYTATDFTMAPYTVVSGRNTIAISYKGVSTSITLTARENTLQSITIESPGKEEFFLGEDFTTDGLKVTAKYRNGAVVDVTSKCSVEIPNMEKKGKQYVKVAYEGKQSSYQVNVIQYIYQYMDTSHYLEDGIVDVYFKDREEPFQVSGYDVNTIDNYKTQTRDFRVTCLGRTYTTTVEIPEDELRYVGHNEIVVDVPLSVNLVTNGVGELDYVEPTELDARTNEKLKITVTQKSESVVQGLPATVKLPGTLSLHVDNQKYDGVMQIPLDVKLEVINE